VYPWRARNFSERPPPPHETMRDNRVDEKVAPYSLAIVYQPKRLPSPRSIEGMGLGSQLAEQPNSASILPPSQSSQPTRSIDCHSLEQLSELTSCAWVESTIGTFR
jgi:hypothetical protein